jgi:hypothetical protein
VTTTRTTTRPVQDRSPLRLAAAVVGAAFLVVGIAGFIPGLTANVDQIEAAGHSSGAELFGVFQVSVLHNVVHLLFGVVGLAAASRASAAKAYLVAGGAVYLVLWLYGLLVDRGSDANFVPLDTADNWLHLGLGLGMIALGVLLDRRPDRDRALTRR